MDHGLRNVAPLPPGINASNVSIEHSTMAPYRVPDPYFKLFENCGVHLDNGSFLYDFECVHEIIGRVEDGLQRQKQIFSVPMQIGLAMLYGVISVVAFVGNALVIYVVVTSRDMRRNNRNIFITNLALSNLLLSIIILPLLWAPIRTHPLFPYGEILCKLAVVSPGISIYCSTLTIAAMSIDRYLTIRRHTSASRVNHREKCLVLAAAATVWVFSSLLSSPLFFTFNLNYLVTVKLHPWDPAPLQSLSKCQPTANQTWIKVAITVLQLLFLYVVPLVVLGTFNALLARHLRKADDRMKQHRARSDGNVITNHGTGTVVAANADAIIRQKLSNASRDSPSHELTIYHDSTNRPNNYNDTSTIENDPPTNIEANNGNLVSPLPSVASRRFCEWIENAFRRNGEANSQTPMDRRANATRQSRQSTQSTHSRTNRLLYTMAFSYAVLWLPFTLSTLLFDLHSLNIINWHQVPLPDPVKDPVKFKRSCKGLKTL